MGIGCFTVMCGLGFWATVSRLRLGAAWVEGFGAWASEWALPGDFGGAPGCMGIPGEPNTP